MDSAHFVRIDRDGLDGGQHYVVHAADPRFTLELTSDPADTTGRGVLRRLSVPNSWAGDYGRYAKLLTQAQDFFARSGRPAARR